MIFCEMLDINYNNTNDSPVGHTNSIILHVLQDELWALFGISIQRSLHVIMSDIFS